MLRKHSEQAKAAARELRKRMTQPEKVLWRELGTWRDQGIVIRRQHPIGNYVADFVHLGSKTVIEVDGRSHDEERSDYDLAREADLRAAGFRVIRVSNDDVLKNTRYVLEHIYMSLNLEGSG